MFLSKLATDCDLWKKRQLCWSGMQNQAGQMINWKISKDR